MWLKATAGQTPQTDRCRIPYRTPNRSGRQEPMVSRIYVEKKPGFDVEAQQLKGELTEILGIKGIEALRIINRYDVEGIDEELFRSCVPTVFSEPQVDVTYDELPASDGAVFAVEFLPGQFDQRADSASECVQLISQGERPAVRSAKVYMISGALDEAALEAIKHYVVNPVEARIASLDLPETLHMETPEPQPVEVLDGFRELDEAGLAAFITERGLAMDEADIAFCQQYFRDEDRDPTITEIRVIDTYWSDHCRHTTFGTVLDDVTIDDAVVQQAFDRYMEMRHELGRDAKPVCLMDMGTIGAKYLKKTGVMTDVDESEEINACTVKVKVDVDGEDQDWLFLFKNETHNHPTEIEPFGGASTCLGGAIRDPLSGRSYVYQAMRVTGAGNIYQKVSDTLEGKLPQSVISKKAAAGYSSYGNQIGLATTHVREIYHDDYVAKRLEVGAVVGAVKAENVRREKPVPGDKIVMLGGRTGRDGIGGATGSSKEHNTKSLETCGSEVQKGNAPEERKLERLFRRPEVTRLIKKSNDFGAGGVSVAIGELADGLDIYLDRVKTKYSGLNSTELAISESQERMAVVVEAKDVAEFMGYCREENIEAVEVADVTDTARMRMFNKGRKVVDLAREFIDSAGAKHYAEAMIGEVENRDPFAREVVGATFAERFEENLRDNNVVSQRGLIEMFDSTIGRSTVLMPFGGRTQGSETQVSVQKLPTDGYTDTASIMAFGYNPYLASWSPYHGAAYAVVEAAAKVVAAGARYDRMRYSYQEYFERMTRDPRSWGKPLGALLGALKMQVELGLPSIGGKDSMSGTFQHINVPPMLMAFGITTVNAGTVISTDFKKAGNRIYLVRHTPRENHMPDTAQLKDNFGFVSENIERGNILAAWSVGFGGVAEGLAKMAFGNRIGAEVEMDEAELFGYAYGSILVESAVELIHPAAGLLGMTAAEEALTVNGVKMPLDVLYKANTEKFAAVYPDKGENHAGVMTSEPAPRTFAYRGEAVEHPLVYIPVFPGTNCDYDTAKAFRKAGAEVEMSVLCNLGGDDILRSIREMKEHIRRAHIFVLSGGFSSGDEPDGSAKFIVNVLNNKDIHDEIHALLDRGGLILGICNGFQALVKSGLLPYGRLGMVTKDSPTLFRNDINRHISQIVSTRVSTLNSPWLAGFGLGDIHSIAVSHGEGKFVVSEELAGELFANGQVAFQYVDDAGHATAEAPYNPNGSSYAIEGLVSRDGQILGKMGHTERYEKNLFKNIAGEKEQSLFRNAVNYFRKN